ncbi:MAG: ROK family protein [Thermoleophilia bacterium]|nr:ROK family protein [Thermoleophilia bacterium]
MAADHVIGVDVGGTKILAGVVDREGVLGARRERTTPVDTQEALVDALVEAVEELRDGEVGAIGFGIPSTIDQRAGRAVSSVNIPLVDVDLRARMSERFGVPVAVENDANAAAVAEWKAGAGRGTQHMVMLTLGTGVGGGLILDGRLYRGAVGAAGELGHVVIEHDGARCQGTCTGRGHLEAVASGHAASERASELFGPAADAHRLVRLAQEGDASAVEALREIGRRLGSAMGGLVNVFNPELIVVGGGFGAAGELLLAPAREVLLREALPPARDVVRIVRAGLGTAAGVVGAGLVAFEALDSAASGAAS